MGEEEMIKEIANIIRKNTFNDIHIADALNCADDIYDAGYRKIADDEIVIKKSEYKELKKYRTDWLNDEKMHLQAELEDTEFELGCSNRLFQKVCKEKKELEEQLKQARKGIIDILQHIKDNIELVDFGCGAGEYEMVDMDTEELKELADKFGIELGEKNNDDK